MTGKKGKVPIHKKQHPDGREPEREETEEPQGRRALQKGAMRKSVLQRSQEWSGAEVQSTVMMERITAKHLLLAWPFVPPKLIHAL